MISFFFILSRLTVFLFFFILLLMREDKKHYIFLMYFILLFILIVFLASFLYFLYKAPKKNSNYYFFSSQNPTSTSSLSQSISIFPSLRKTSSASSTSFGLLLQKNNLSLPSPLPASLYQNFHILAQNNAFSPNQISANLGQIITLTVSAQDRPYDIFFPDFNVYKEILPGQSGIIQFQPNQFGKYLFTCRNYCASPSSPSGTLIINLPAN